MKPTDPAARPTSTYRLQFGDQLRFLDAAALVPYLVDLGITDCYSSPILKPTPGSTHGYDTCDHERLNDELGSDADYLTLCRTLRQHGLGHIVDFVPNHMSSDATTNRWWRDVLENGPSSPYGRFFDIDWQPVKPELHGKVLLPLLGDQYGRVLERGELRLEFAHGALHLRYFNRDLPINPRQSPRVLGLDREGLEQRLPGDPALREFLSILTALQNLPPYTDYEEARIAERQREKEVARERLALLVAESAVIRQHVNDCVRQVNGTAGDRASFDRLHDLLEHQVYRLAYWRTAVDEINYRRFFDINELVSLRMEDPAVFEATHRRLVPLIADGDITGLRIDHPDGLFDPAEYFARLQRAVAAAGGNASTRPLYVVAEKILSGGETVPADWPVAGTTGYEFLNRVSGLFVDGRRSKQLRRVYARLTGRHEPFEEIVYASKRTIMLTAMASELNVLAHALNRLSERERRHRDFTLNSCRAVLREVIACFPVYRTYVTARGVSAVDAAAVREAITRARRRNPLMEVSIFEFVEEILLASPRRLSDPDGDERLRLALKVQQYTGPVHAKGVEDTAFYRYHVLVSVNDVGGEPGHLGVTPAAFHEANRLAFESWPDAMITTATHDTKRGEDARMRINVLSEVPDAWRRAVAEWMQINARYRTRVGAGSAPDRNDEYLFYQTLIGIWPPEPIDALAPGRTDDRLVARLRDYMQKAIREAKVHTSWINQDEAYSVAVGRFVEQVLTGRNAPRFLRSFLAFQRRVSRAAIVNSLAQLVLKLASPGVTDIYQGNELWDLSLVDPDNRQPVDFARRRTLLSQLMPLIAAIEAGEARGQEVRALLDSAEDGRVKLLLTALGLRLRRRHYEVMHHGRYEPLEVSGPASAHVVAFARRHESGTLIAAVPRLLVSLAEDRDPQSDHDEAWGATRVVLPSDMSARGLRQMLTGERLRPELQQGALEMPVTELFRTLPVALAWVGAVND